MDKVRAGVGMAGTLLVIATGCGERLEGNAPSNESMQAVQSCAITPVVGDSLFVTDPQVLSNFPLKKVMDQIVATGSNDGQTSLGLYQQLFDTLNAKDGGLTRGPHCDDQKNDAGQPALNGFPILCPRQEGILAGTDPFAPGVNENGYTTLGLSNRFDLAPANGANCGQYRVVYGLNSGLTNAFLRTLLIFEAVLPNPDVDAGLSGCLPVARFWDDLSAPDAGNRAQQLDDFYFKGLHGFAPVVRAQNYGMGGGTNTGQIRTNMFMFQERNQEWELREFRLSQSCGRGADGGSQCSLMARNTPVQNNPFGGLFTGTLPKSADFEAEFLNQVQTLAASNLNGIAMSTATDDNAGQSDEQDSSNDYAFQAQNNHALLSNIQSKLSALHIAHITPQNILDRATTQSCAGCHEVAIGRNLGGPDGGLVWPFSNGFTQIDESRHLSAALTNVFLPARSNTLVKFINAHCGATPADPGPVDPTRTVGGGLVGSGD